MASKIRVQHPFRGYDRVCLTAYNNSSKCTQCVYEEQKI